MLTQTINFTQKVYKNLQNTKLDQPKIGKSPYVIQQVVLLFSTDL